jgi:hypothetical protein
MQGVCVNYFCGMKSSPVNRVFVARLEVVVVDFSCHFLMRDQQQMVQHLVGILTSGECRRRTQPEAASILESDVQCEELFSCCVFAVFRITGED